MTEFRLELYEPPITWDKLVERCRQYHKEKDHMCGVTYYESLPAYVTLYLSCHCEVDYRVERTRFADKGIAELGFFCNLCGKPRHTSLHRMFFTCEGCYKFFTYDFRLFENKPPKVYIKWPLANILCRSCDVPVTSIKRTGGISFS